MNPTPPMFRDKDRAPLCLAGALCLHVSATLLGSCEGTRWVTDARASASPLLLDVAVELPQPTPGVAPGGGSPEPDPAGAAEAPRPPRPAPRASKPEPETEPETEPELPSDVLASTDASEQLVPIEAPRLRPARTFAQLQRPASTPDDGDANDPSSRFRGLGPGANGGPGGPGAGWGKGKGSPFGGAEGAFRADVCFIPEDTRNLKELNGVCNPVLTLFTSVLDVPPRSFTSGFPGVSDRFEWFAVFYRGKFRVKTSNHYRFRLLSDDGSILFIDGHRIIDNDGQHAPQAKQMTIPLEAGEHDVFVQYYQGHREIIALQLFVRPDGEEERLFSPEL